MIAQLPSWEPRLLSWAQEGLNSQKGKSLSEYLLEKEDQPATLAAAFEHCERITRLYSRTFFLASGLLPQEKRQAVRALYAFCRTTDDLVDRQQGNSLKHLAEWERSVLNPSGEIKNKVALAWNTARMRFQIPRRYAEQMVEGVKRDITQCRYETFDDLVTYCYGVASTVGLMSMHIIGFNKVEAVLYAIRLGIALQLTNILRDIGEDWRKGRLYLPQEELDHFKLGEGDIAAGNVNDRWRSFMRFQIERNRLIYRQAIPGIRLLHADGRFAIHAAARLYQAILEDIERHDYNVFDRRAYVSTMKKIIRLPGIWVGSLYRTS